MKKTVLYLIVCLSGFAVQAQEPSPSSALRYAIDDTQGTARFRGMSGAFGAVGGDMSSINVNPAGTAILSNNTASGTLSNYNASRKSNYFGDSSTDNTSTLDLNQLGGAFVFFNTKENSDWKKFVFAINYENANDYENNVYYQGTNPNRSISDYFTAFANGPGNVPGIQESYLTTYDYTDFNFMDQQAWLGYQSYIIDPTGPDSYTSNAPAGNFYQQNSFASTGYNGKVSINLSSSYKDKIYFGVNFNAHFTDYTQSSLVYESNTSANNTDRPTIHTIDFQNDMHTYGSGFSMNLGVIAKVTKDMRLGLAFETPTWYRLTDELSQAIYTTFNTGPNDPNPNQEATYLFDEGIVSVYPEYKLQTPGKVTGSFAYVFGKQGLISFDYSIKDYSTTTFRPKNELFFNSVNTQMSNELTTASEFRVGAEYRVKQVSLRGGYRFEQSPYKDGKTVGDLTSLSAGLGYNFGDSRLDLAFTHSERDYYHSLLSSYTDAAKVQSKMNNLTLSYTINF
nr:transporter [uncultured Flavobacterium sp.]